MSSWALMVDSLLLIMRLMWLLLLLHLTKLSIDLMPPCGVGGG